MLASVTATLHKIFDKLHKTFGPQQWWPGETKCEIIVGAILTQNTNWSNVEKALKNLKRYKLLNPLSLKKIQTQRLAALIKPAGYFNVKAQRLKNFFSYLFEHYEGSLTKMGQEQNKQLRINLLEVNGIGPETADSILLYAFNKPFFVVDTYTKRIFYRHNLVSKDADYHSLQNFFINNFKRDVQGFNEYHALIVYLGKNFCKSKPLCEECPLNKISYSLENKCPHCHRAFSRNCDCS